MRADLPNYAGEVNTEHLLDQFCTLPVLGH